MRPILFLINLVGLAISCSYFFWGFNLLIEELFTLVSHFIFGAFQFIFSLILIFQRKKTNRILDIHFALASGFLIAALLARSVSMPIDEDFGLGIIPCLIAIVFSVGYGKLLVEGRQPKIDLSQNSK